jgi:MFS family permease
MFINRWGILAILMFGLCVCQLEQTFFSHSISTLQKELQFSSNQIGLLFSVFTAGMIVGCILITLVTAFAGTRWGLTVGFIGIAVTSVVLGLTGDVTVLIIARFAMGFFAAALLPAAIQAVREWFPVPLRPLAIGLGLASMHIPYSIIIPLMNLLDISIKRSFLAATSLGAIIAAILCAFFLKTPRMFETPNRLNAGGVISTLMLALGLFFSASIPSFFNTFLPLYLSRQMGMSMERFSKEMIFTWVGSIAGTLLIGAIACILIYTVLRAPKARAALLTVCGCLLTFVIFAGFIMNPSVFLLLTFLSILGYYGIMTLLYSSVADTLPAQVVAIAVAIGSLAINVNHLFSPPAIGYVVNELGFRTVFLIVGGMGLVAWLIVAIPSWFIKQPETAAPPTE